MKQKRTPRVHVGEPFWLGDEKYFIHIGYDDEMSLMKWDEE